MAEYIITDGSRFIYKNHAGKFVPGPTEAMADVFTKKQAEGILNGSLPKALKSVFRIEKWDSPPDLIKQATKEEAQRNNENTIITENIQQWIDKVSELNGLKDDALKRKENLCKQLSDIEKELTDLAHYVEFCDLNAAQGYKAYKMIKERRIQRRAIKNEIAVIDVIIDDQFGSSLVEQVTKAVHGMEERTYVPRALNELFDM